MSLNGIPISENQCIGDSLQYINEAFIALDSYVNALSTNVAFLVDRPGIPLQTTSSPSVRISYDVTTSMISADVIGGVRVTDFTGFNQQTSQTGYQKLPGGVLMQWGVVSLPQRPNSTDGSPVVFQYPIQFPRNIFNIQVTPRYPQSLSGTAVPFISGFPTLSTCAIAFDSSSDLQALTEIQAYVFAVGN
jgi:hypothetical protein